MVKKYILSLIFLTVTPFSLAKNFDQKSLIMTMEVWEAELNDEEFGNVKMTISFIGHSFYPEDLKKARLEAALPDATPIVGFISSSLLENKNISKECHFPRVQIHQIKGLKTKNRIFFWTEEKNFLFSGTYNELLSVQAYQITNVKDNSGDLSINSLRLRSLENENAKVKIVKVQ